jgi:hypothetical protein
MQTSVRKWSSWKCLVNFHKQSTSQASQLFPLQHLSAIQNHRVRKMYQNTSISRELIIAKVFQFPCLCIKDKSNLIIKFQSLVEKGFKNCVCFCFWLLLPLLFFFFFLSAHSKVFLRLPLEKSQQSTSINMFDEESFLTR